MKKIKNLLTKQKKYDIINISNEREKVASQGATKNLKKN